MIRILAAVIALAAGSASAQDLQSRNALKAALETARVSMNDGNEIGELVVTTLDANRVVVFFSKQTHAAVTGVDADGKKIVSLSDALPAYPRPIALALAREAAEMIVSDMTPSSEREYMKASIAARAWLELGGEGARLPVVEPITGATNQELSDGIAPWVANRPEMALYRIGQAKGTKSVVELMQDAKTADEKAKLEADNARFVSFLRAEHEWRRGR